MAASWTRTVATLACLALTPTLACSVRYTTDNAPVPAPTDGAVGDAGSCGTCQALERCNGAVGACVPCTERVLYVKAGAPDTNSGCSPDAPIGTIGHALGMLQKRDEQGYEIRVCGGEYPEGPLLIDRRLRLRGGFACDTWQRGEGFGYAKGWTDGVNSQLTMRNGTAEGATLTVRGLMADTETLVEGFVITGRSASSGRSVALEVSGSSQVTVQENRIEAGEGTNTEFGSVGLYARESAPKITFNRILGGLGHGSGIGAVGLVLESTLARVLQNEIAVDTKADGTTLGCVALQVLGITNLFDNPIQANRVRWSNCISGVGVSLAQVSGPAALLDNVITGRTLGCAGGLTCTTAAIAVSTPADVTVSRNRIYGGDLSASLGTPTQARYFGIFVSQGGTVRIANNAIHAGTALSLDFASPVVRGIQAETSARINDLIVESNTILAMSPSSGQTRGVNYTYRPAAPDPLPPPTVKLRNNLVLRSGAGFAVCGNATLTEFTGNAFSLHNNADVSTPGRLVTLDSSTSVAPEPPGCPSPASGFSTLAALEGGIPNATKNLVLPTCLDIATCASQVFGTWTPAKGYDQLLEGFSLGSAGPCSIAKGAVEPLLETFDVVGTKRVPPSSIGARHTTSCTP
jgi:hypothetical protein